MAIAPCACLDGEARYDLFEERSLGQGENFSEISLRTCRTCGRPWLHLLLEFEAFAGSGRWYRGLIAPGDSVTAQNAPAVFAALPGYFAGGSHFNGRVHRQSGALDLQLHAPGGPARRTDFRPPAGAREACLSPDLTKLASIVDASTLRVEDVGSTKHAPRTHEDGFRGSHQLAWSPQGNILTFLAEVGPPGSVPTLNYCDPEFDTFWGLFHIPSYAWEPHGRSHLVASFKEKAILRVTNPELPGTPIFPLRDDGDPLRAPWIAPSPDGTRVAYTCRRVTDAVTEVWVDDRLLTQIPGSSVHPCPFWSPDGRTLGLHVIHLEQEKSAILVVPDLEGGVEILHQSDLVDPPGPAAWSPSGRSIAFFRTKTPKHEFTKTGEAQLVMLDAKSGELWPLSQPGEITGRPRFVDGRRLAVEGGPAAHLFEFEGLEP